MLAPFTPHICEEMWEMIGKKTFVSKEQWPKPDEKSIKPEMDHAEELIKNLTSDIRTVLKLAKVNKPKLIKIFISPNWKYDLFDITASQ